LLLFVIKAPPNLFVLDHKPHQRTSQWTFEKAAFSFTSTETVKDNLGTN